MVESFFSDKVKNADIKAQLEIKLSKYNNITYAYAIMNKNNPTHFSIISNKPEWFDFYMKNNYQFIDPVLITAAYRVTPFTWESEFKSKKIFNLSKNYNIIDGLTFVLHDQYSNLVVLSIITNNNCDDDILKRIENDKGNIQMSLNTLHESTTSIYKNGSNIFTKRENEIIYWSSVGKSYPETAIILGIKLTTVKYHMSNVLKKLGVTNVKHAIGLAVELRLIRPIILDT